MASRHVARSPSRSVLAPAWEDGGGVSQSMAGPFMGVGCTCGAGQQLEAERQRLVSISRCLAERGEALLQREGDLEARARDAGERLQRLELAEHELAERQTNVEAQLAELPELREGVERQEERARQSEQDLSRRAEQLEELEGEAIAREDAVAGEELRLMEDRNQVEAELERIRSEREELDARAKALGQRCEDCIRQLEEAEHERQLLGGDESLLTEIEQQVGLVRRSLAERERTLEAEEAEVHAREADGREHETQLLRDQRAGEQALSDAEERLRELRQREADSAEQHRRLLQRQRDLGSKEVRISGLESALRLKGEGLSQQRGANTAPDASAVEPPASAEEIEQMQRRLQKLRSADADWVERVRLQQLELARLEARARQLEAAADGRKRSDSRRERRAAKVE